jgi:membrane-bound lytic murein transglycosylase D
MGGNLLRREILIRKIGLLFLLLIASWIWGQENDSDITSEALNEDQVILPELFIPNHPLSLLYSDALAQSLTQHYIKQYSAGWGLTWLHAALERGAIYLPFIISEVEKYNLPPELAYLPVIESGFVSTARSKSGAMGLWQFMMNSISPFNIKVNDYIDERRDFQKATRAALQKLEENYRLLGNWELALAAYNSGLGSVTRTIKRTKNHNYWELCQKKEFRAETIHYVPKLMAISYIILYKLDVRHEQFEYASIPLSRQVSLDILAREAEIDKDLLYRLNAELTHGITPNDNYLLKIPADGLDSVTQVLERKDLQLIQYHRHVIRQGDTLWALSRLYNVSIEAINQHNPGLKNNALKIADILLIPATNDAAPVMVKTAATSNFNGHHVVRQGDTLWSLAREYGVDIHTLAEANNMNINQILSIGKSLKVPIIENR